MSSTSGNYIYTAVTVSAYAELSGNTLTSHSAVNPGSFIISGLADNLKIDSTNGMIEGINVNFDANEKTITVEINKDDILAQKNVTVDKSLLNDNYTVKYELTNISIITTATDASASGTSGTLKYTTANIPNAGYLVQGEQIIYYNSSSEQHNITISGLSSGWTNFDTDENGNITAQLNSGGASVVIGTITQKEKTDNVTTYTVALNANALDSDDLQDISITSDNNTRFELSVGGSGVFNVVESVDASLSKLDGENNYVYAGTYYQSGFTKISDTLGSLVYDYNKDDTYHPQFTLNGDALSLPESVLSGAAIGGYITVGGDSSAGYTITLGASALIPVSAITTVSTITLTENDSLAKYTLSVAGVNESPYSVKAAGSFSGISYTAPTYEAYYKEDGTSSVNVCATMGGGTITFSLSNATLGTGSVTADSNSYNVTVGNLFTATGMDSDSDGIIDRYDLTLSDEFLTGIAEGGYVNVSGGSFVSRSTSSIDPTTPVTGASFAYDGTSTFNFSASITQADGYTFTGTSIAHTMHAGGEPFALTGSFSSAVTGKTFTVENDGTIKLSGGS
ncbi:MAG: hypothetical protein IKD80_02675, partial [Selenomonadaceae bacterium]|nr:hypothetical protein [Selenomonadaceae bacterium]